MLTTITLLIVIVLLFAYLVWITIENRNERQNLITALIAKTLPEYAMAQAALNTSASDRLKKTKAENKLAMAAQEQMDKTGARSVPIT